MRDRSQWIVSTNHHEPIISQEQFDRCAMYLQKNHRGGGTANRPHINVHIFAGLLHCGYCGSLMQSTVTRKFRDGLRQSMYMCGERRVSHKCQNKFVLDRTVGSFLIAYIGNMIKLQKFAAQKMYVKDKTIQEILLDGDIFEPVAAVTADTLSSLRYALSRRPDKVAYRLSDNSDKSHAKKRKRQKDLQTRVDRLRRALDRLENVYLFSEDPPNQKAYLAKRAAIRHDLIEAEQDLADAQQSAPFLLTLEEEEFIRQAGAAIFRQAIEMPGTVSFNELVEAIGRNPLKDFFNTVLKDVIVKDGRIIEITWHNGTKHGFLYK